MISAGRRRGAGALLAISIIGVVVTAIMVLAQGYLSEAVGITDAVLAGRRAEYLAEAAANEALYMLQEQRNSTFLGLFAGGGSQSLAPVETQALAADGVDVGDVTISASSLVDVHGDGRHLEGTVTLEAWASVPRRVARVLGTSAYRTVQRTYEFKVTQLGSPMPFGQWPLWVRRMRNLPEVETWYEERIQRYWNEDVRLRTFDEVRADAQEVVEVLEDHRAFVGRVVDLYDAAVAWPDQLTDPVGGQPVWALNPEPEVENVFGPFDAKLERVRLRLDSFGDVFVDPPFPAPAGWKNDRSEIPAIRPLIREEIMKAIRENFEEFFGPGTDPDAIIADLRVVRGSDTNAFHAVAGTEPGQRDSMLEEIVFRAFREDGADLGSEARVEESPVTHQDLMLQPPTNYPRLPDSPLVPLGASFPDFSPDTALTWIAEFLTGFDTMAQPFRQFPPLWPPIFTDYLQAWDEELTRYEELILLESPAPEELLAHDYWARTAAYEFPSAEVMRDYIASRWGRAGAVYRFGGGSLDLSGLDGDSTYVGLDGSLSVGGSGTGKHTVVGLESLSVDGNVRAALLLERNPVDFDGGSVNGSVAAAGLKNLHDFELDPFTLTYEDMTLGMLGVSVCEYPTSVVVERGGP